MDCPITAEDAIAEDSALESAFEITVRTLSGQSYELNALSSWTLLKLYAAIRVASGVPECEQRLCVGIALLAGNSETLQTLFATPDGKVEATLVRMVEPNDQFAKTFKNVLKALKRLREILELERDQALGRQHICPLLTAKMRRKEEFLAELQQPLAEVRQQARARAHCAMEVHEKVSVVLGMLELS